MTVPRADGTLAARVKKLEEDFRRIRLTLTVQQSEAEPEVATKGSVWFDSTAGNEPKVFDGTAWVPVRDATIAAAQSTADTAQATVDPLVPLTDLAGVTDGLTITGATNETADPGTGPRVVLNDPAYPGEIVLYTGEAAELVPARIRPIVSGATSYLRVEAPKTDLANAATRVDLGGGLVGGLSSYQVDADQQHLFATDMTIDGFSSLKLGDGTDYITIAGQAVTDADLSSPTNTFPANPQPATNSSVTDILAIAGTSFAAGTPVVGTAFVAPPTGKVYVTVSGHMEHNTASQFAYLSFEIRDGAVVGSGTPVHPAVTDEGLGIGSAGTPPTRISASGPRNLITGLTPGTDYNIRTMHLTTGGTFDIFYRSVLVEPVL